MNGADRLIVGGEKLLIGRDPLEVLDWLLLVLVDVLLNILLLTVPHIDCRRRA